MIARIRSILNESIAQGSGERPFTDLVNQAFEEMGVSPMSPWHLSTVWRTNTSLAYAGGQMSQAVSVKKDFPYWRYSAVMDMRTRPAHAELNDKIFANGDFRYWPPIDYNCRCTGILISRAEAESLGLIGTSILPDGIPSTSNSFIGNKNQLFLDWLNAQIPALSEDAAKNVLESINNFITWLALQ